MNDLLEEERQVFYEPAENQIYPIHSKQWFLDRIGKKVYRTSRVTPNLCYVLQMMEHSPEKITEKWITFDIKKFKLHKKYKGCGEWRTYIKPDNMPKCLEDVDKQFISQDKWGFRFFDEKPYRMQLSEFEI